jgi:hypothetical protein
MKKKVTKPQHAASPRTVDRLERQVLALIQATKHLHVRLHVLLATVQGSERR